MCFPYVEVCFPYVKMCFPYVEMLFPYLEMCFPHLEMLSHNKAYIVTMLLKNNQCVLKLYDKCWDCKLIVARETVQVK